MITYLNNESSTIENSICLEFLCDRNIDGTRLQFAVYSIERLKVFSPKCPVQKGRTYMLEFSFSSESRWVIYLDDEPVRHNSSFDQGLDGGSGLSADEQRTQ